MTAVTLTRAEAAQIDRAHATLRRALNIPWPEAAAKVIGNAVADLQDALETHSGLVNDTLHWEAYDSDLRCYAEPYEVAVTKSAEDAEDAARYLAEVIGKHIGEEAAAYVGGGTGGTR
jgi:hypothetical protein